MTSDESVSSGTALRIWAMDDVRVAGVLVAILDEQGKVIEKGDCEALRTEGIGRKGPSSLLRQSGWWEYVPGAEGKVIVEARDLAGNVAREGEK